MLAEKALLRMKSLIDKNPVAPVSKYFMNCVISCTKYFASGHAINAVRNALNVEYEDDPDLLSDLISALSKKIESGMNLHRTKILGNVPKEREDFIPGILLEKLEGGSKVLVLDSDVDLPKDWDIIDMKEKYGFTVAKDNLHGGGLSSDGGSSDGGGSEEEANQAETEVFDPPSMEERCLDDQNIKPPRVLVFTTCMLVALLAVCRAGSVDGTFKAMSKQWKQLFIFLVCYKGAFIPIAFGWLPDKSEVSYHIFTVLVMEAFYSQREKTFELFGKSGLRLKKIKLDFEKAIHNALGSLFSLKGCFFHFR